MLKNSLRLAWRGLNHLTRVSLAILALALAAVAIVLLGLRYWVLPDIERYHDRITDAVSQAIDQPVRIGRIVADWDGLRPRLVLQDVHILDKSDRDADALVLRQVKGSLAWTTLLTGKANLHSLEVEQPDLLVRRDAQGVLHVAGITLSEPAAGSDGMADWLLDQSRIVVRDARITWLDELRGAPALTFQRLNLRIQNRGRRHRFAVVAEPPAQLASRLDVRGDFVGQSFDDLPAWRGRLYTRLDYVDAAAWRPWLPLPDGLHGRGAVRGWLGVSGGRLDQATADLRLSDVQANDKVVEVYLGR